MVGQVSSVVTPSSRRAMGRRARWSMSGSVSKVATTAVGESGEQVGDRRRRAHAGVDPPLEGHHQDRPVQADARRVAPSGLEGVELLGLVAAHSDSTSASARSPSRTTVSANWSTPLRSPAAAPPA